MICVERDPIVRYLESIDTKGAAWTKQKKVETISDIIFMIAGLKTFDLDDPNLFHAPSAKKIVVTEPIFPYGSIGKDNYHCGHCKERVKRKDRFCRSCGYEFVEDDIADFAKRRR